MLKTLQHQRERRPDTATEAVALAPAQQEENLKAGQRFRLRDLLHE
jgi:hypothetical protein